MGYHKVVSFIYLFMAFVIVMHLNSALYLISEETISNELAVAE